MNLPVLAARLADVRRRGGSVVFTNGCFDVIHAGHVKLLAAARSHGDFLVVGLNSDASVRRLKGSGRPRNRQSDRRAVLEAIRFVDAVVIFSDPTPLRLVRALKPDVLVKGADYGKGEIVGEDDVKGWGGAVVRVPLLAGRSTTKLLLGTGARAKKSGRRP